MVTSSSCFINHKVARYNRVMPLSIQQRQAACDALPAALSSTVAHPSPESPSGDKQLHFASTLRQDIPAQSTDSASLAGSADEGGQDTPVDDAPPALDFDDSDAESDFSQQAQEKFMSEQNAAPKLRSTASL